jgi:biopolymer transport protein ExbD
LLTFIRLFFSSHVALVAENLFLRKQLALFQERKTKPGRTVQKLGSSVVYLRADKETAWNIMIQVLDRLQTANIQTKLLVTWPLVPQDPKRDK